MAETIKIDALYRYRIMIKLFYTILLSSYTQLANKYTYSRAPH